VTGLRVVEWGFRMEGYFARDFEMVVLAIQEDLRPEARRAREMEAEGYEERPLAFKWRQKACYTAANVLEVDPDAVRALRPRIEREQPDWVERVKDEWESFRDVESVAFWAEVPIQVVVAILLNLEERGELKVDDDA
jgi:hypothetical protein